jgi:hypothetical protein
MSRTAADVRQTVVPSSSLLPYTHVGFSIATTQSYSREFFNTIGRLLTVGVRPGADFEISRGIKGDENQTDAYRLRFPPCLG